jgi:hypothetical protein
VSCGTSSWFGPVLFDSSSSSGLGACLFEDFYVSSSGLIEGS